MTPEEQAHNTYLLIMNSILGLDFQHEVENRIRLAIRAAVADEREHYRAIIKRAASHLPGRPDLAESVLSVALEGTKK